MFFFRRRSSKKPPSGDGSNSLKPHSPSPPLSPPLHPHPHCALCDGGSLQDIILPLSRLQLYELCNHIVHSDCDISRGGRHNMTLLHHAVLKRDEPTAKALMAFGADINAVNDFNQTPLNIAQDNEHPNHIHPLIPLLVSCGCVTSENLPPPHPSPPHPSPPHTFSLSRPPTRPSYNTLSPTLPSDTTHLPTATFPRGLHVNTTVTATTATEDPVMSFTGKTSEMLCRELEEGIKRRLDLSASFDPYEAKALVEQQREVQRMRRYLEEVDAESPRVSPWAVPLSLPGVMVANGDTSGCRILSLDGGGMKGLIQIEVLSELERVTGKRIRELFDCIIGTSTGGIIALSIVHRDKPLSDLRRLYFRIRDEVFSCNRGTCSTVAMETILKEEFGTTQRMTDVTYPKVLVSAVDKSTVQPKLCFFNNCFNDEFSDQLVWKVARYTSAAPLYFTECDNYVDGGILANNPCDTGLSRLQQFHQCHGERMAVSCVVSIGSGIMPSEPLGLVDPELNLRSILSLGDNIRRTTNLLKLLSHALCESEQVAKKCESDCQTQCIPYFRFCPHLPEKIEPTEVDMTKLLDMIIVTKIETTSDPQLEKLRQLLLQLFVDHGNQEEECKINL